MTRGDVEIAIITLLLLLYYYCPHFKKNYTVPTCLIGLKVSVHVFCAFLFEEKHTFLNIFYLKVISLWHFFGLSNVMNPCSFNRRAIIHTKPLVSRAAFEILRTSEDLKCSCEDP